MNQRVANNRRKDGDESKPHLRESTATPPIGGGAFPNTFPPPPSPPLGESAGLVDKRFKKEIGIMRGYEGEENLLFDGFAFEKASQTP